MSSSRSDSVTQFVCVSVCPVFSFSVLRVLSSDKVFQWCFKNLSRVFEVSRMYPVNFKGVYKKFKGSFNVFWGSFKSVSRNFQENFKDVSRVFQVRLTGVTSNFKRVSRVIERSLKGVKVKFQWCYNAVSRKFQECFKKSLWVYQKSFKGECFKGFLVDFKGIWKKFEFQGSFKGTG